MGLGIKYQGKIATMSGAILNGLDTMTQAISGDI